MVQFHQTIQIPTPHYGDQETTLGSFIDKFLEDLITTQNQVKADYDHSCPDNSRSRMILIEYPNDEIMNIDDEIAKEVLKESLKSVYPNYDFPILDTVYHLLIHTEYEFLDLHFCDSYLHIHYHFNGEY